MLDFDWSKEIIRDVVDLTDCIELIVAFSGNEYNGRFTGANFTDIVQGDIFGDDNNSFLKGDDIDDFYASFEDSINLIKRRALWLGQTYPFIQKNSTVQFAPSASGHNYLWYLFLLACSSHNRIPTLQQNLSIQFENVCKEAMRVIFPSADVFLFSKNSDDRKKLGATADKAIPALAKKLNTHICKDVSLSATQKEYGIDLIAIYSFEDDLEYPFFAFAQCTVGKEWWKKRHEAQSRQALVGILQLNVDHSNFLMIPHFPRVIATKWSQDRDKTVGCILCDRYRICRLLEKSTTFTYQNVPPAMRDIFNEIQKYLP